MCKRLWRAWTDIVKQAHVKGIKLRGIGFDILKEINIKQLTDYDEKAILRQKWHNGHEKCIINIEPCT